MTTQNETRRCPHSRKCGGCQLQNLTYAEQLEWKNRLCVKLLGRFAHVEPILGMENPYHYRNKVQAAFGTTRAGRIISGIYPVSYTHLLFDAEPEHERQQSGRDEQARRKQHAQNAGQVVRASRAEVRAQQLGRRRDDRSRRKQEQNCLLYTSRCV